MPPEQRPFIRLSGTAWLAMGLAVIGALTLGLAGAVVGAFLGGLLGGPRIAIAWSIWAGVGGLTMSTVLPHLPELASFGSTALLLIPAGCAGGIAAGLVAGRSRFARVALAHALTTAIAAVLFRLGHPFVGFALAGPLYGGVLTYGATTAE